MSVLVTIFWCLSYLSGLEKILQLKKRAQHLNPFGPEFQFLYGIQYRKLDRVLKIAYMIAKKFSYQSLRPGVLE